MASYIGTAIYELLSKNLSSRGPDANGSERQNEDVDPEDGKYCGIQNMGICSFPTSKFCL